MTDTTITAPPVDRLETLARSVDDCWGRVIDAQDKALGLQDQLNTLNAGREFERLFFEAIKAGEARDAAWRELKLAKAALARAESEEG